MKGNPVESFQMAMQRIQNVIFFKDERGAGPKAMGPLTENHVTKGEDERPTVITTLARHPKKRNGRQRIQMVAWRAEDGTVTLIDPKTQRRWNWETWTLDTGEKEMKETHFI